MLRRTYPASVEDLWAAITDPPRLRSWFTAPDGVSDVILGVGMGWELAMVWLDRHIRGEGQPRAPGRSGEEALQPAAEDQALLAESTRAWTDLVDGSEGVTATPHAGDRPAR